MNLLGTKRGRLAAFFFLYVTEGIPLGFTATAIATQMRRQGVGVAEIGAFVSALYLPWAFKWVFGPIVDTISSDRWGRRRTWILITQLLMALSLLAMYPINFATQVSLFTALVIVHNVFGATQDVAIDALAVNVLTEQERGLANGLMFGGAYLGQAIGGSGVLFLTPLIGFPNTFFVVAGAILLVTVFVVLPMREAAGPTRAARVGGAVSAISGEIYTFVRDAFFALVGTRGAFLGLLFAALPAGAYALGLALQSNLAVELGLDDAQVGALNLWSSIISAFGCVAGGWLSDRFGRRRMLALYIAAMSVPTLLLAWQMQGAAWIHPIDPTAPGHRLPTPELVMQFWTATLTYSFFNGLMYGTRTALFMDVTVPRVAATQFTAYMAMLNFVISYSARWQGLALARWGYPATLALDGVLGLLSLVLLPWIATRKDAVAVRPGAAVELAAG
jgi:MFS family permease